MTTPAGVDKSAHSANNHCDLTPTGTSQTTNGRQPGETEQPEQPSSQTAFRETTFLDPSAGGRNSRTAEQPNSQALRSRSADNGCGLHGLNNRIDPSRAAASSVHQQMGTETGYAGQPQQIALRAHGSLEEMVPLTPHRGKGGNALTLTGGRQSASIPTTADAPGDGLKNTHGECADLEPGLHRTTAYRCTGCRRSARIRFVSLAP